MFAVLPARRAVVMAFVGGWLFLPVFGIDLKGIPPFSKVSASAYAVLLGAAAVRLRDRLLTFRPRWFDLPIFVWCFTAPRVVHQQPDRRLRRRLRRPVGLPVRDRPLGHPLLPRPGLLQRLGSDQELAVGVFSAA